VGHPTEVILPGKAFTSEGIFANILETPPPILKANTREAIETMIIRQLKIKSVQATEAKPAGRTKSKLIMAKMIINITGDTPNKLENSFETATNCVQIQPKGTIIVAKTAARVSALLFP